MIFIRGVFSREMLVSIWFVFEKLSSNLPDISTRLLVHHYKSFSELWEHKSDYARGQWEQDNCTDLVPIHYTLHHKSLNCYNISFLESPSCLKYSAIAIYGRVIVYCLCLKYTKIKLTIVLFSLQRVLIC
jgi:hypothetical protein